MGMGTAGYVAASGAPVLIQVAASGAVGGISSGATHRALTGQDTTPEAVAMDGIYGSFSALTFYGTGLAYERVTAPKLPNTYIRDRLAAAEEMNGSEGCDAGSSGTPSIQYPGNDSTLSPGEGWEWRGPVDRGSWYKPETGETLHPDLMHPYLEGPHWDYIPYKNGPQYRVYPDGTIVSK